MHCITIAAQNNTIEYPVVFGGDEILPWLRFVSRHETLRKLLPPPPESDDPLEYLDETVPYPQQVEGPPLEQPRYEVLEGYPEGTIVIQMAPEAHVRVSTTLGKGTIFMKIQYQDAAHSKYTTVLTYSIPLLDQEKGNPGYKI